MEVKDAACGSHSPSKLAGAIDLALYADADAAAPGDDLAIRAALFNGKAGHCVPSGSAEERMLWLEVAVTDPSGKSRVLPVERKGFPLEEHTIADRKALAYQDMGDVMDIKDFKGISRDGAAPDGCRIFRRPFFDPEGRMTICQWHTAKNTELDYRIGPRETKIERYAFSIPEDAPEGERKVQARLFYAQIPSSLGEFMKLPADEYAPILVGEASLAVKIEK